MDESRPDYLPTTPATFVSWETKMRARPCWRCRYHLRWPPWRKHWGCMFGPRLRYLGDPDEHVG